MLNELLDRIKISKLVLKGTNSGYLAHQTSIENDKLLIKALKADYPRDGAWSELFELTYQLQDYAKNQRHLQEVI
jgi:hypothetical protein